MFIPKTEYLSRTLPPRGEALRKSLFKGQEGESFKESIESLLSADAVEVVKNDEDLTKKEHKQKKELPQKETSPTHLNITV